MDLIEAVKTRKTIRAFKLDPVPQSVLKEILETARNSPSWAIWKRGMRIRPWKQVSLLKNRNPTSAVDDIKGKKNTSYWGSPTMMMKVEPGGDPKISVIMAPPASYIS